MMKFKSYIKLFSFLVVTISAMNLSAAQSPEEDVSKARLLLGPDRWVQLHYFLQSGFSSSKTWNYSNDTALAANNESKDDAYYSKDFFVRRSRLILNGSISKNVKFFFQSEDLKSGKSSSENEVTELSANAESNRFTQDAFLQLKLADELQIYAGLMAIPFSRQNNQSAATTLGLDLNTSQIPLNNYSNNGRDTGLMLRGLLFNKVFEYRLGAFRGLDRKVIDKATNDVRNKNDYPRLTGRFQFNILDSEEGFFYSGNYLGKRNVIALGFGVDYQKDVFKENGRYEDYMAWSADLSIDIAASGGNSGTFQVGMFNSENNPVEGLVYDDDSVPTTSNAVLQYSKFYGMYAQLGVLMWAKVQPVVKYTYRRNKNVSGGASQKYQSAGFGLNYFILEHHANVKLEYVVPFGDNKDYPDEQTGTLQFQIYL